MTQPASIVPTGAVRACYNNTGLTLAAGAAVMLDSGGAKYVKLPTGYTVALFGVVKAAIPTGEWGDVQVSGVALVLASAALATPGIQLMAATDGKAEAFAAAKDVNVHVLGQLLSTATAANELVEVDLNGIGTIQQGA